MLFIVNHQEDVPHMYAYVCGIMCTYICNKQSFNAFFQTSLEYCKIDIRPLPGVVWCGGVLPEVRTSYTPKTSELLVANSFYLLLLLPF